MNADNSKSSKEQRNPWFFVPSLYFAEGLVYVMVNTASVIMYKKMGMSNIVIGLTSFLYLPWVIKMFWAPLVDIYKTKRYWILFTQFIICLLFSAAALFLNTFFFFTATLTVFLLLAFFSATHDICTDGFYMLSMSQKNQAFFVGIRSVFYRAAMIMGSGILVYLAGKIETSSNNIPISWTIILVLCSIIYLFLFFYHSLVLPHPKDVCEINKTKRENVTFLKAFKSYFEKNGVWIILFFILFYRLGEAFLVKMISPFMLENPEKGGLGLETSQVGLIYGTVGIISMIVGGILGGVIISKFGLKKCLWPMALSLNIPDLFYVYIASFKPSVSIIYPLVAIEQFGYGFGLSAFTVVLLYFSRGKYQTSHYAISTGFMAVGMMFPGMASGFLQELLGYLNFFVFVCFVTIPGMIILFYLPKLDEK